MQKLKLPIGIFNKGSVIYIDYIFDDDSSKRKKRPAVVIDFDDNSTRVIILKVTTHSARTGYDYTLADYGLAGLKQGSVVRCNNIMTVPNKFNCEKHGDLSRRDAIIVESLYNQAIINNALVEVSYT